LAQEFIHRGYHDVYPLLGGMDAWRQAGFPLEDK